MKVFAAENRMDRHLESRAPMPHEHGFRRPLPPHERRELVHLEFAEEDITILNTIFGDSDTAQAAAYIIMDAPPEIQIITVQLLKLNGSSIEFVTNTGTNSFVKFPSPTMDETAQSIYEDLYGDAATSFVDVLNTSPDEIAVLSRIIAYLAHKRKE